jgi:hypothetical protein
MDIILALKDMVIIIFCCDNVSDGGLKGSTWRIWGVWCQGYHMRKKEVWPHGFSTWTTRRQADVKS